MFIESIVDTASLRNISVRQALLDGFQQPLQIFLPAIFKNQRVLRFRWVESNYFIDANSMIDISYTRRDGSLTGGESITGNNISLVTFKIYNMTLQKILTTAKNLSLICLVSINTGLAETRYVTDQFEVTLRSGTSTSNSIIQMVKSGQAVTLLEEDVATKYSLVETRGGKKGYILSRFLDREASGRERYSRLKERSDKLKETIAELSRELDDFKQNKQSDNTTINQLQNDLNSTRNELEKLKESTRDTIRVIKQNDTLKARINELESEKVLLITENTQYKDSTAMDWFIRGASVSLVAFLLGIIVTRIRWKKRDSWGSY